MSRRLKITLPDPISAELDRRAATLGEPVARLAARILLKQMIDEPSEPSSRQWPPREVRRGPSWLEPPDGNQSWRAEMWNAVASLHQRYPDALRQLADGWWEDKPRVETLCALAIWRREIDESGDDPREELDFHRSLTTYSNGLRSNFAKRSTLWDPSVGPTRWRKLSLRSRQLRELDRAIDESSPDGLETVV